MKIMPKELFDSLIKMSRQYWETGDKACLTAKIALSQEIMSKAGVGWLAVQDLVDSIIRRSGFFPNADNDMIYSVLRVMGWEVTDEVKESESL